MGGREAVASLCEVVSLKSSTNRFLLSVQLLPISQFHTRLKIFENCIVQALACFLY